jgi:hypothetical protein
MLLLKLQWSQIDKFRRLFSRIILLQINCINHKILSPFLGCLCIRNALTLSLLIEAFIYLFLVYYCLFMIIYQKHRIHILILLLDYSIIFIGILKTAWPILQRIIFKSTIITLIQIFL